ncbi:DUF3800 domain-containing protein [Gracilibacillus dipsosauri]|uniref:DUF3800 domain-containing protein n=1 Tax=Gracilibacillus dipsosauri TaxID=178340 RepID=UPI002409944C
MYKWFADDTELRSENGLHKPNIFLFGGIVIEPNEERKLIKIIKDIKSRYTYPDLPVKWNFKDLKQIYKRFDRLEDYNKLLCKSHEWRKEIFQRSLGIKYKVVISMLENFQYDKNNLKEIKGDLNCILFANSLMRLGLFSQRVGVSEFQIILDWPENKDPTPFNNEYYYAFNRGRSKDGIEFLCGPLCKIGFQESVMFTKMSHSNSLQFADMIMGSFKGFCESQMQNIEHSLGKDLTEIIIDRYDRHKGKIHGIGVNVPSNNPDLKDKMREILSKYEA